MTRALLAAVALLLALLGWQWGRAEHAGRQADAFKNERDVVTSQLSAERAARAQDAAERRTELVWAKRLQENLDAERIARHQVETDARRAAVADSSLRGELARLASRARAAGQDSAVAGEREAALSAIPVLTELLGRCSERRTELARYADDARVAGQVCQRAYDALMPLKE